MPKDLVGAPGTDINKRTPYYIEVDSNNQIMMELKEETWGGVANELGWTTTPTAGRKLHTETYKEAFSDWGCIPVVLISEDSDGYRRSHKTVAAPGTDLSQVIGKKIHSTLDIVKYKIGW